MTESSVTSRGEGAHFWLSPEFLSWHTAAGDSELLESVLGIQALEEWDHAALRLNSDSGGAGDRAVDRKDAVAALSRAVERRIQLFRTIYAIGNIPGICVADALDQLEEVGLARGLVLRQVRKLRNKTEHESQAPPSRGECLLYWTPSGISCAQLSVLLAWFLMVLTSSITSWAVKYRFT